MAQLPWLQQPQNQNNDLLSFLMSMQPTAAQSIGSSLPFLNLPKKQQAFYQPFYQTVSDIQNPDSAGFQKVYGQKKQVGQRNLAEMISELQRQNRKQTQLGRTPLFSAERGGETLFRGLSQGYQDVQDRAYDDTFDTLTKTAALQNSVANQQAQFAANKAGVKGNLQGALIKLFGL